MATSRRNATEGFKSKIENHPVVVYLTIAVVAFVTGVSAAWWLATKVLVPSKDEQIRQLNAELQSVRNVLANRGKVESIRSTPTASSNNADARPSDLGNAKSAQPLSAALSNDANARSSISVSILTDVVATNLDRTLVDLRKSRKLRELTALESGKRSSTIAKSAYFFCFAYDFEHSPPPESYDYIVNRFNSNERSFFEIHRLEDGHDLVIGFTSSSEGASVSYLQGDKTKSLILFPYPTEDQHTLVSIPVDRITSCVARNVELDTGNSLSVLDMEVR